MRRTGPLLLGALLLAACSEESSAPPAPALAAPAPSASSAPAPAAATAARLDGTILAAVSSRGGPSRLLAIDPAKPEAARDVTPPDDGVSWYPAPTSVPMAIATSELGGTHGEQLVALGAALDDPRLVGPSTPWVRSPVTTAGGETVVLELGIDGVRNLHRIDVATSAAVQLTTDPQGNFEPSLSPDGKRVAFTSSRDGDNEIYVMDLPPAGGTPGPATRLTAFHRDDWSPLWSPTGEWIAFLSDREGSPRLFVVAPDGTGVRRAYEGSGDLAGEAQTPAWSPDGKHLAVVVRAGTTSEIFVADIATATATRIAAGEAPAWSPDGEHLVYVAGGDLHLARRDGRDPQRLTSTPDEEWIPRWYRDRAMPP